jgi:hypothetical protein
VKTQAFMSPLTSVLAHFRELEQHYRVIPRGREAHSPLLRKEFNLAHVELYQLAQAICAISEPSIQARLDRLREDVVAYLELDADGVRTSRLEPTPIRRPIRWSEIMLTPELEGNLALSGRKIPYKVATALRAAHRAQVDAVRKVVGI